MSSTETLEKEYVQQREFDIYIQSLKERADSDKELTAARFDKFEAVVNGKIDRLDAKIDRLDGKIDRVESSLSMAIEGILDRLDDMKDYQNKCFTVFGILFTAAAIIAPVAVALIQKFVK